MEEAENLVLRPRQVVHKEGNATNEVVQKLIMRVWTLLQPFTLYRKAICLPGRA